MGDPRPRWDSHKFIWTLQGVRQAQEASADTRLKELPLGPFVGCQSSQLKKMHNLKIKNCILFSRVTENLSLGGSLLENSEGLLQRGKGGGDPGYTEVFETKTK